MSLDGEFAPPARPSSLLLSLYAPRSFSKYHHNKYPTQLACMCDFYRYISPNKIVPNYTGYLIFRCVRAGGEVKRKRKTCAKLQNVINYSSIVTFIPDTLLSGRDKVQNITELRRKKPVVDVSKLIWKFCARIKIENANTHSLESTLTASTWTMILASWNPCKVVQKYLAASSGELKIGIRSCF